MWVQNPWETIIVNTKARKSGYSHQSLFSRSNQIAELTESSGKSPIYHHEPGYPFFHLTHYSVVDEHSYLAPGSCPKHARKVRSLQSLLRSQQLALSGTAIRQDQR